MEGIHVIFSRSSHFLILPSPSRVRLESIEPTKNYKLLQVCIRNLIVCLRLTVNKPIKPKVIGLFLVIGKIFEIPNRVMKLKEKLI